MSRAATVLVAVSAIAAFAVTAVAPSAGARGTDVKLSLAAYSTPREAYAKLIPLFQKTPVGQGI